MDSNATVSQGYPKKTRMRYVPTVVQIKQIAGRNTEPMFFCKPSQGFDGSSIKNSPSVPSQTLIAVSEFVFHLTLHAWSSKHMLARACMSSHSLIIYCLV
jgi:hypothetical protein